MRKRNRTSGVDWEGVRDEIERSSWEAGEEPGTQCRSVFLGHRPSGKVYTPWACSNLDPCPACGGAGTVPVAASKRRRGKAKKRLREIDAKCRRIGSSCRVTGDFAPMRRFNSGSEKWGGFAFLPGSANAVRERLRPLADGKRDCGRCGGLGSHEAWDDQRLMESLEEEASEHGYFIEEGQFGIGELYAVEYRDVEDDVPQEEEDCHA